MITGEIINYSAYKDSKVEWINKIPVHWKVTRIKDLTLIKRGASPRPIDDPLYFDENGEFSWVRIADLSASERYLLSTKEKLSALGASLSVKRYPGDFILSIAGTVGKPIITKIKCCIHDGFVWFPTLKINPEFLYYCFSTGLPYQGLGKLGTQLNLNTETVGLISVPMPTPEEVTSIVYYLDTKISQIDCKIDLLTKKATKYVNLRQSLINETVIRGLDKSVEMKDSRVEWIGEVPEHWAIIRLKDVFIERSQKGFPEEPILIASQDKGVTLKSSYSRHTMTVQKDFHLMKLVKKNDYVISLRSFEGGIEKASSRGIISAAYTVLFPFDERGTGFYKYLFKSNKFISMLVTCTTGIREGRNVNYQQLKRELLPVPSAQERQHISNYLDDKTVQIDRIVETINLQINKLKELRKTLINEVVTGKINVTVMKGGSDERTTLAR